MNKLLLIFLIQALIISTIHAQELFFTEYQSSSNEYVTVKYSKNNKETINKLAGFNFHVLPNGKVYHSNLNQIFTFSFADPTSKPILKPEIDNNENSPDEEEYILSFDVSPNGNLYYEIGSETYRLDPGVCKLFKWSNGNESQLAIPRELNFINFDISPDEEKIVFQHTILTDERNIDYLMLYNFKTEQLDTIASDINVSVDINQIFTEWNGNSVFYLNNGEILEYNLNSKTTMSVNIPFNGEIRDFEKVGSNFYFIDGSNLFQWDGAEISELYKAEKYNFISCLRTKYGL